MASLNEKVMILIRKSGNFDVTKCADLDSCG